MIRTRVGYAGGQKSDPTYRNMGDHTETLQVDYDPSRISYSQLLDVFWKSHNPEKRSWSRQYKRAIFYHNESQRQIAETSKANLKQKSGNKVRTEVNPLRSFTMAEDYHQKYILKGNEELKKELEQIYPLHKDFVNSTAVSRLNGYMGGNGDNDQLSREIEQLGLSSEGKRLLFERVGRR